jgi:hypothetical protein
MRDKGSTGSEAKRFEAQSVEREKRCEGSEAPQLENLAADVPGVTRVT